MIIKNPEKQDIPALRHLWKEAFGDTDDFLDLFFEKGFSPDRCQALELGGELAAALYWFDCGWENKKIGYLYAVATAKSRQGQGLCRALMTHTHKHLQHLGYQGAALSPAEKGLFSLYEKFGYKSFCPTDCLSVAAEEREIALSSIDAATYRKLRKDLLPQGGILQEGATLTFLEGYAKFYQLAGGILCAVKEGDTLYMQEYLADPKDIPAVAFALGAKTAQVRLLGKTPSAMYLSFENSHKLPTYLGILLN